jgi:hypothetical protein
MVAGPYLRRVVYWSRRPDTATSRAGRAPRCRWVIGFPLESGWACRRNSGYSNSS